MALTKITVNQLGADSVTTAKIADDVELGGSPTTTTQSAGNNSTRIATTAYTEAAITALTSGAALNEYIADTVGAMVGSNTESGITVAYQDGDNTLDFTVGTLNQNTTGTAATVTDGTQAAITSAANLVTVGTIGTGTWQGTAINQTYLVGQSGTNTGDQTSVSGNAGTATVLATARTIGGVSFNGSANISLPGVNAAGNQNTSGTAANLSGTPNISVGTIGSGNVTTTGYIRGPASFTIDPATHGDDTGTVVIAGNLQVDGTTTTINSTTVAIDDLNFSIATDAANSAAANGAGITIGGAAATLLYTHATTSWDMNKPLNVTGALGVSGVATFGTHVVLGDSDELRFGAGNDARIFSDGTNGYIRGVLALQNSAGNKDFISAADGGATTLYHDNAVKLATVTGGINITGDTDTDTLTVSGTANTETIVSSHGASIAQYFGTGVPTLQLTGTQANGRGGAVYFKEYANSNAVTGVLYSTTGADGYGMVMSAYGTADMKFATGGLTSYKMTIKSDGKVGIGTTSPSRELHVYKASSGATATSGSVAVFEDDDNTEVSILGGSSSVLALNFGHSGDNDEGLLSFNTTSGSEDMLLQSTKDITLRTTSTNSTAGDINFKSYNTTIMTLDGGNNNVGIGTTSPADNLHLNESGATSSFIRFSNSNVSNGWSLGAHSGGRFQLSQNGVADRLIVDSSGNVGIGTTSPSSYAGDADNLVIYSAAETGMTIASGTNSTGDIYFADGTSGNTAYRGIIQYHHGDDSLRLGTAATEKMRILSGGNVGIGITSPLDILHLNDPDDDCVLNLDTAIAGKNSMIKFSDPANQGRGFIQYAHWDDSFRVTVAGAENLRIVSSGYVQMAGAADVRLTLGSQGTAGQNSANWIRGNGTSLSYNAASANHIWEIGGTEKMRIASAGQIGIGGANYGSSGQVLTSGGSGAAPAWGDAGGGAYSGWSILTTTPTTLVAKGQYICNDTTARTHTLPAGSAEDTITICNAGTGLVTLARTSSQKINSADADGTLPQGNSVQLVYVDSTIGWFEV